MHGKQPPIFATKSESGAQMNRRLRCCSGSIPYTNRYHFCSSTCQVPTSITIAHQMTDSTPPSPTSEPPPPAYELSQAELDAKIAITLERSVAENNAKTTYRPQTETEWEEWDEEAYERAATALRKQHQPEQPQSSPGASGSSSAPRPLPQPLPKPPLPSPPINPLSSSSSVRPLSIVKKHPSPKEIEANANSKERPSWYAEAGLDNQQPPRPNSAVPYTSSSTDHVPPPSQRQAPTPMAIPPPSSITPIPTMSEHSDSDDEDDAPPPFSPIGPSYEGPPFEEVMRTANAQSPSRLAAPPINTSMDPNAPFLTSPPVSPTASVSPLGSFTSSAPPTQPTFRPNPTPPPPQTNAPNHHMSLPPPPRQSTASSNRNGVASYMGPRSSYRPPPSPQPMQFDPSIAYKQTGLKSRGHFQPDLDAQPLGFGNGAAAFYKYVGSRIASVNKVLTNGRINSSAVSSLMVPSKSRPLPPVQQAPLPPTSPASAISSNSPMQPFPPIIPQQQYPYNPQQQQPQYPGPAFQRTASPIQPQAQQYPAFQPAPNAFYPANLQQPQQPYNNMYQQPPQQQPTYPQQQPQQWGPPQQNSFGAFGR
jgi:hypothetical protein